jgi:hypothetical protein
MNTMADKYCLDANVLIEAWQKYYNPKFCLDYWNILIELGKQNKIFIPELVYEEITRTEDDFLFRSVFEQEDVLRIVSRCRKRRCVGYTEAGKSFVGMANL